jgi:universal stress protein family protein
MVIAIVIAGVLVTAGLVVLVLRWRNPEQSPNRITPPAGRILFPFRGESVSRSALDATLRLARAEGAVLVPAYIVSVPLHLSLDAPLARECERAMPLLDVIEQRAKWMDVPVDSRIETGRSPRHALRRLLAEEKFDRIVVPAATSSSTGFAPEDIAWLLEEAPGEIVVLRANGHLGPGQVSAPEKQNRRKRRRSGNGQHHNGGPGLERLRRHEADVVERR